MQTQEKRGRGRPKGSNSFQSVTLKELIEMYSEDTQIPVGRLWLKNGLSPVKEMSVTVPVVPSVESPAPENRVEMTLVLD